MKKLLTKDKKIRIEINNLELKRFVLKQISKNINFLKFIRWKALYKLINYSKKSSKTFISNRCVQTINKKKFHPFSKFSRMIFLRLATSGQISGLKKSSW